MHPRLKRLQDELIKLSSLKKDGKAYKKQLENAALFLPPLKLRALRFISTNRVPREITSPMVVKEWADLVELGLAVQTAFGGELKYLVISELGFKLAKARETIYPELPL